MRLALLLRHCGRGVSEKLTRAMKNPRGQDAKRNTPELIVIGELQSKDEPTATRPLYFHILVGQLHLALL